MYHWSLVTQDNKTKLFKNYNEVNAFLANEWGLPIGFTIDRLSKVAKRLSDPTLKTSHCIYKRYAHLQIKRVNIEI